MKHIESFFCVKRSSPKTESNWIWVLIDLYKIEDDYKIYLHMEWNDDLIVIPCGKFSPLDKVNGFMKANGIQLCRKGSTKTEDIEKHIDFVKAKRKEEECNFIKEVKGYVKKTYKETLRRTIKV